MNLLHIDEKKIDSSVYEENRTSLILLSVIGHFKYSKLQLLKEDIALMFHVH